MLTSGEWRRTAAGLYYAGRGPQPWLSRAWAATLVTGGAAVVGGTSAAILHQLLPAGPGPIQVFVPCTDRVIPRPGVAVTRSRIPRRTQTVDGLPCTTVPEAIVDCAAILTGHDLEALIGRAFQRGRCSKDALRRVLAGRRTVAQRDLLAAAADDVAAGAHSPLEIAYLRTVERPHGLPTAARQIRVGQRLEWADVWYEPYRVIAELDGRAFHERSPFRDAARDNRNSRAGHTTLRYGWADVLRSPCDVARQVAACLTGRGWDGASYRSCGRSCTAAAPDPPHEPPSG